MDKCIKIITDKIIAVDLAKIEHNNIQSKLNEAIYYYGSIYLDEPKIVANHNTFNKVIAAQNVEWISVKPENPLVGILAYYTGRSVEYDENVPDDVIYLEEE